MMKSLKIRLLTAFAFVYAVILAGLGFVLGQLFPVYLENTIRSNSGQLHENLTNYLTSENIKLNAKQQNDIQNLLPSSFLSEELTETRWHFWLVLIIALISVFILLMLTTNHLFKKLSSSVEHVTHTALELAQGNYRARAFETNDGATTQLSKSINVLARNLQDIMLTREVEQERLKTLIDNMGSALVMIGREGEISVVNNSFLSVFNRETGRIADGPGHRLDALRRHVGAEDEPGNQLRPGLVRALYRDRCSGFVERVVYRVPPAHGRTCAAAAPDRSRSDGPGHRRHALHRNGGSTLPGQLRLHCSHHRWRSH